MLRSLRSRLILSHILPLVIILPLMILALIYLLETQVLIPQFTQELLDNARVLTRVVEIQPGRVEEFTLVVSRADVDPNMRLVYLDKDGVLLYSNDPDILPYIGNTLMIPGLERASRGQEVIQVNYNFFRTQQNFAQVLFPVTNNQQEVIGVLWVTYFAKWVAGFFNQLRFLSLAVIALELSRPNRSLPKLLYYAVIFSHPVLFFAAVAAKQESLAFLYVMAYLWSHWIIALGPEGGEKGGLELPRS